MSDHHEIANTLNRFMNCFDLKEWRQMTALLESTLQIDYADLRGGPPSEVTADEYVGTRADGLQELSTHHLLTNLDIEASGDSARASASCMIYRRRGEKFFDSHAFYRFGLTRSGGVWRISAISQRILWNDGDPTVHGGAKQRRA